jgi:hypothetical protein
VRFRLVYRVADCDRPSADPAGVTVVVRRWWGAQAVRVPVPDVGAANMIGWPHVLAQLVGNPPP